MNSKLIIRLAVLITLTVVPSVIQGRVTERWSKSEQMQMAEEFVTNVPKQLGEWKYASDAKPMTPGVISELGVTEYISRVYVKGDQSVTLLLMAGNTGRLIRHTPNICYAASGNKFLNEPTPVTMDVDGKPQEFRVLPIRPADDVSGDFVVVYGFAHAGEFKSPASPRFVYHGLPAVEKIQVLCNVVPEKLNEIPEYAKSFIEEICRYNQEKHPLP